VLIPDVNVLVYAFRADSPRHEEYRGWLERRLKSKEAFGLSDLVLSGVLRILTHPRVFAPPTPTAPALAFVAALRERPNVVLITPGPRHWEIFTGLCRTSGARGNLIADAYHAAMAIEHGAEWITTDRDYTRFPGLRSSHPLE
jgi:uncharacterized protein